MSLPSCVPAKVDIHRWSEDCNTSFGVSSDAVKNEGWNHGSGYNSLERQGRVPYDVPARIDILKISKGFKACSSVSAGTNQIEKSGLDSNAILDHGHWRPQSTMGIARSAFTEVEAPKLARCCESGSAPCHDSSTTLPSDVPAKVDLQNLSEGFTSSSGGPAATVGFEESNQGSNGSSGACHHWSVSLPPRDPADLDWQKINQSRLVSSDQQLSAAPCVNHSVLPCAGLGPGALSPILASDPMFQAAVVHSYLQQAPQAVLEALRNACDSRIKQAVSVQTKAVNIPIEGNVLTLAFDYDGCRRLQSILEHGGKKEHRIIRRELQGHVPDAIKDKQANFVVQKFVERMDPRDSQFIVDEIASAPGSATAISKHAFGCRVIQRLFEHCRAEDLQALASDIVVNVRELCIHEFGNYVVQHVLVHGRAEHKHGIATLLVEHGDDSLFRAQHVGIVLARIFEYCNEADSSALAERLLGGRALLAAMATQRFGHVAVLKLLELREVRPRALDALTAAAAALRASAHGRRILASLQPRL